MSELDVIQDFYEKDRKEKIDKYRILNEAVVKGQILPIISSPNSLIFGLFSLNIYLKTRA